MDENYSKILERLVKVSGVEAEEINRRVEAKRAKLSGLISREGALQVIAAELGVSFDNEKLKINELLPGMRKVNFSGQVITIYPIRTFTQKNGDQGKVANMIIADDTGNIKVVLWDTNHIELLEKGDVVEGVSVQIISGSMRDNEVHMGSFSELKVSKEIFNAVKTEKEVKEKKISEFVIGDKVKVRAFSVQNFEPKFFLANPETGKKATEEEIASGAPTEKKVIWNLVLDDGSESIRAVLFHENAQIFGLTALDDPILMAQQRFTLMGLEKIFYGNVKMNSYFHTPELIVESIEEPDLNRLIKELEK
jgi:replication factor A1